MDMIRIRNIIGLTPFRSFNLSNFFPSANDLNFQRQNWSAMFVVAFSLTNSFISDYFFTILGPVQKWRHTYKMKQKYAKRFNHFQFIHVKVLLMYGGGGRVKNLADMCDVIDGGPAYL